MDSYPPDEPGMLSSHYRPSANFDPYKAIFNASTTEDGEINFAPVAAEVKTMEWLYLAAKGHRRAYFDLTQTPVKMAACSLKRKLKVVHILFNECQFIRR